MRVGGAGWARALALAAAPAVVAAWPAGAQARSTFVINNLDAPGVGLNDPTPAAPVGGNSGTTLGQQRLNVFKAATDMWGAALDSNVPIVVDVRFGPLACDATRVVLGQARANGLQADRPGLPPNMYFPDPLANRIAEVDLTPGESEIDATFNGDLAGCTGGLPDWYYGLDGKPPSGDIELLFVVLHELCHGLGFISGVDLGTGELVNGILDSFSAHVFDNSLGMAWSQMTDAQRAASIQNVRHLVWNGPNVARMAPQVLARGAPRIGEAPVLSGFAGTLAEANFGPRAAAGTVAGRLVVGSPLDGCALPPSYTGAIVLFAGGGCPSVQKTSLAQGGGAVGILIADPEGIAPPSSVEVPPDQNAMFTVRIPAVGVTIDDADLLASAAGVTVTLSGDGTRLVGADDQGRPYLYASNPILPGSTVSHWDPLARPSLLQEPNTSYDASHDLRMEVALLRDIGWTPFCGNGRLDPDEACDDGAANSDTAPGACRTTCVKARCGDGVTDPGEACDDGTTNSNTTPGACRTTCVKPKCGDSVTDPGEQCDDGTTANSDTAPGACRTTCKRAACGDGVVDPGEACDDGPANGPSAACRPDCTKAPPPKKGCGCALGDGGASPGWTASLPALLALAALRRRRRRGASPR